VLKGLIEGAQIVGSPERTEAVAGRAECLDPCSGARQPCKVKLTGWRKTYVPLDMVVSTVPWTNSYSCPSLSSWRSGAAH
jgi:hypothetical protein